MRMPKAQRMIEAVGNELPCPEKLKAVKKEVCKGGCNFYSGAGSVRTQYLGEGGVSFGSEIREAVLCSCGLSDENAEEYEGLCRRFYLHLTGVKPLVEKERQPVKKSDVVHPHYRNRDGD
jgi:hypothetical protein